MFKSKLIAFMALLLVAGMVQAGPGHDGPKGRQGMMGEFGGSVERMVEHLSRVADDLALSDEQVEQMFTVTDASRGELRQLMLQMQDNKQALHETTGFDVYDADAIAELATTQGNLVAQMIIMKSRMRAEIMTILSPEQRGKAEALKSQRHGRHGR